MDVKPAGRCTMLNAYIDLVRNIVLVISGTLGTRWVQSNSGLNGQS